MKECDILGDQNILTPSTYFQGSRPTTRRIYSSGYNRGAVWIRDTLWMWDRCCIRIQWTVWRYRNSIIDRPSLRFAVLCFYSKTGFWLSYCQISTDLDKILHTPIFHSWWCETCRVTQQQFWM